MQSTIFQRAVPQIMILIMLPALISAAWFEWGGTDALDDAFISFNYALNISEGHGIVYNPGGEHTQGYTNFLFVLLIAAGLVIDIFPPTLAWILNTIGIVMIGVSFRVLAGRLFQRQSAWLALLSVPIFIHSLSLWNLSTGLETLFWSGLVFLTATMVMLYIEKPRHALLTGIVIASFLAGLTRPDTGIFIVLWFLYLLIIVKSRRPILIAAGVLGLLSVAYIGWLQLYFGDFLPNPFYIKVTDGGALPGWDYVRDYLERFAVPLVVTAAALVTSLRRDLRVLAPYAVVLMLLPFYTYSDPIIGHHFRFLYPVTSFVLFLTTVALVKALLLLKARFDAAPRLNLSAAVIAVSLLSYLLAWNLFYEAYTLLDQRLDDPTARETPIDNNAVRGKLFAQVPGIRDIQIAYGDAGQVAYYSRARFLDMAGLNENHIARAGTENGADWVIDYILQKERPDVIGFFNLYDGTLEGSFHGPLTPKLFDLFTDAEFQENYVYLGGFNHSSVTMLSWFVRADSPHREDLQAVIGAAADIDYMVLKPPSG